jgi:hypothetical protein
MDAPCSVSLLPFERALLVTIARLEDAGEIGIFGSQLVQHLPGGQQAHRFVRSGWLYRALGHLVAAGLLESWMEDGTVLRDAGRRPRRYYRLTVRGRAALAKTD